MSASPRTVSKNLDNVHSNGHQKYLATENMASVAATSLRPVAATVANLPSIHYFVTHFAKMVTRPLTSPVQPR